MLVREAAVDQRFAQTFIGILELHIFSNHPDAHFPFGLRTESTTWSPWLQIACPRSGVAGDADLSVESLCASSTWHVHKSCDIIRLGNHARFRHVAEESDFVFELFGNRGVAAAKENVGLNSDASMFFDGVLRGLGFQFAGCSDIWNQRDVNDISVLGPSSRRIWRIASRNGSDSMSPTVPPISTMHHIDAFGDLFEIAALFRR